MTEWNPNALQTFAVPMSSSLSAEERVKVVFTSKAEQGMYPTC